MRELQLLPRYNLFKLFSFFALCLSLFLSSTSANAQTSFTSGVDYTTSTTATLWFKPTATVDWVNAHYTAGAGQQNVSMTYSSTNARYEYVISATVGTAVNYSFTYSLSGLAYDSSSFSVTVTGPSSSSAASSVASSAASSVASSANSSTASGFSVGVTDNGSSVVIWIQPNSTTINWADVHFNMNSTGQQNFSTTYNGSTARYEKTVATTAGVALSISYSFTYGTPSGAVDSAAYSYNRVLGSSSAASSVASSAVSSSVSSAVSSVASSANSSTVSGVTNGVTDNGSSAIIWLKPNDVNVSWAVVHYNVNSTGQQNFTMTYNSTTARYEQSVSATAGAALSISYSFTYNTPSGALDSAPFTYNRTGSSSSANSSANSSTNSSASSVASSSASDYIQGASDLGGTSTIWFKTSLSQQYVLLHYSVGTGSQINPQMTYNSTTSRWEAVISPLSNGVNIHYSFTYQGSNGANVDSPAYDHTFGGTCTTCPPSPSFSPLGGSFYTSQSVSLSTNVSGGVIHYTLDGSAPNSQSPVYTGTPISITTAGTINAITVDSTGQESAMGSQTYVVNSVPGTLNAPTFSHASGTYSTIIRVTMAADVQGTYIHYTLDGSTPTISSPVYSAPIEVKIDTTKTPAVDTVNIKAIAVKEGWTTSAVSSATYTVTSNTHSTWNGYTTFNIVNGTNGRFADSQVYWAIIGKDWNTGKFVHVDMNGNLQPMSLGDNGQLTKNGVGYANYFYSLAQTKHITIPAINSARLLMSVGSPMYIWVNQDVNGNIAYAGANIENPNDPNIDITFDFGEFAILPPSTTSMQGIFINTTRVDHFGFPVQLSVTGLDGFSQTVGEPLTESRDEIIARFINETPTEFHNLALAPYAPYRVIAPAHASFQTGGNNANYLGDYIDSVWEKYRHEDLTLDLHNGWPVFTGHVSGDTFIFTDGVGTYQINGKPTTSMAMLGNGYLDDATGVTGLVRDKQLQLQAQVCAALNRRVAHLDGSTWHNSANFYPAGQAANYFTKFWHDHAINGLAYGFSYDDVGGYSPSIYTESPTSVTFTVGW